MTKIAAYRILPEFKLVLELIGGDISVNDVLDLKTRETEDKNYSPNYDSIVSVVHLNNFAVDSSKTSEIIDLLKSKNKVLGERKCAILTDTPNQVVQMTLYKHSAEGLPVNYEIVSSVKGALKWVEKPYKYESAIATNIELLNKMAIGSLNKVSKEKDS